MPKDTPKKHPTVGPQAVIDKVASALVATWFANGWNVQPLVPNYHEDYIIERIDAGELSGAKVSCQQKGHATMKFSGGFWSEQIKTKHLRYYAEKLAMPVFLFVVDTTKKKGYFLFVQEWLDQNSTAIELKKQKKMRLRIPLANDLEDQPKFLAAFRDALAYMAKKNPGTIEDAIQGEVKKLVAIDPRWDVKLDVVDSAKLYTLQPKEDVPGLLEVSGPNVAKLKDHFDYGNPVQLDGGALKIEGLPIFDHLIKEKFALDTVALTPSKPFKVEFNFWSDGADGFRLTLPGQLTKGSMGLAFHSHLPGAPLRAEMRIPLRDSTAGPKTEGTFTVNFAFHEWENKSITALAYFDKLRDLADAIVGKKLIRHEVIVDGNRYPGGTLGGAHDPEPFEYAASLIENLAKARAIVTKLGVQVILPQLESLAPEDFEAVEMAHAILLGSSTRRTDAGFKVGITLHRNEQTPVEVIAQIEGLCTRGGMTLTKKNQRARIYGTTVSLGDVTYSINPVRLVVPEPGRTEFVGGRCETAPATLESLPGSEVTVTVSPAAAGAPSDSSTLGGLAL